MVLGVANWRSLCPGCRQLAFTVSWVSPIGVHCVLCVANWRLLCALCRQLAFTTCCFAFAGLRGCAVLRVAVAHVVLLPGVVAEVDAVRFVVRRMIVVVVAEVFAGRIVVDLVVGVVLAMLR